MAREAHPFGDDLWAVAGCSSGVRPQEGGVGAGVDGWVLALKGVTPGVHRLHSEDTLTPCPCSRPHAAPYVATFKGVGRVPLAQPKAAVEQEE